MNQSEKYQKCLNFIKELYSLKNDTLVSISESIFNEMISKEAEQLLKDIGEFDPNQPH